MRALQVSIMKVNEKIVLLPGAERLMDSTACLLRSARAVSSLDDTDSLSRLLIIISSIPAFTSAIVAWRIDLERLRDTVPTLASSISFALTDCISRLEFVYRHFYNVVLVGKLFQQEGSTQRYTVLWDIPSTALATIDNSMKELPEAISELCHTTNLLTSQVIPYLSDRRRALKEKYLAISAIVRICIYLCDAATPIFVLHFQCALFCTMPVDLLGLSSNRGDGISISCLSFLATSCSAASFIISLLIVRFFDEACSLLPETKWGSLSRLILWSPLIFLFVGGLSFMMALARLVVGIGIGIGGSSIPLIGVVSCTFAGVVITIGIVIWRLTRFFKRAQEKQGLE